MALIDEINNLREKDKKENSIIDVNDDYVINTMYKCMVEYIKNIIKFYVNTYHKFTGFVFANNLCSVTTYKKMADFSRHFAYDFDHYRSFFANDMQELPLTICLCSKPSNTVPNVYYIGNKRHIEDVKKISLEFATCNSLTRGNLPFIYRYNNNICLYPLNICCDAYGNWLFDYFINLTSQEISLKKSVTNNYDNLILKLSELLKKWFNEESLINNTVNVKTFDQIIPIKKIPCYKAGLFGNKKLVKEEELIPSNCNNKVIAFEVEW